MAATEAYQRALIEPATQLYHHNPGLAYLPASLPTIPVRPPTVTMDTSSLLLDPRAAHNHVQQPVQQPQPPQQVPTQQQQMPATVQQQNGLVQHKSEQHVNGSCSSVDGRESPGNEASAAGKLFVGGLSWQTSSEKLRQYFGMFGNITDVLIMKDPVTQRSRGFGFITFEEPSSVENVLKVPIHTLDGKKIDPKHATPKGRGKANGKTKKIFVGGVSQDTSSDEVKAYFSQFGKVEEAVMLMDQQTKRHRGFGFVTFENEETVDRVCEIHFHNIKSKKVECKKAMPKEVVASALLGKRMVLGPLGVRMGIPTQVTSATQLAAVQAQAQVQAAAAAAAAAQAQSAAAVTSYGKIIGAFPPLASFRYAPYPISAVAPPTSATPNAGAAAPALAPAPAAPYPYSLTNVDMSSFQGVDWGSMYGNMGMYV